MNEVAGVSQGQVDGWELGSVGESWRRLREWRRDYFAPDHRRALQTAQGKLVRALDLEGSGERDRTILGEREINSATSGRGADFRITQRTRGALLALAVMASVGIHIGLTPEHLQEMPRLGVAFIVDAVLGAAIAVALVSRPDDRGIVALAGLFCLAQILVWVLFVTIPVPLFPGTPEPVETIALVSKAVEAIGWVLAAWILRSGEVATRKRGRSDYRVVATGFSSTSKPM